MLDALPEVPERSKEARGKEGGKSAVKLGESRREDARLQSALRREDLGPLLRGRARRRRRRPARRPETAQQVRSFSRRGLPE